MKEEEMFIKIRKIVARIPKGKVATYGEVAKAAGLSNARIVGWALRGNQDPKIPCHRVVKKEGFLAKPRTTFHERDEVKQTTQKVVRGKNYSLGGWQEQKRRLESEGVYFISENQVDLKKHQWKISQRYYSSLGGKQ